MARLPNKVPPRLPLFDRLLQAIDFLDDDAHEWSLDEPDRALAAVEGLSRPAAKGARA